MHQYTPDSSTWHSTVSNVDDGDAADATAWNNGDDDVADNAAYLYANLLALIAGGTLNPAGTVTFSQKIKTSSGKDIEAGDDLIAGGDVTAGGNVVPAGQLRGQLRLNFMAGPNADTTFTVADRINVIYAGAGLDTSISATRTYTLSSTGATNGDIFFVTRIDVTSSNEIIVANTVNGPFTIGSGSSHRKWAAFMYGTTGVTDGWHLLIGATPN